MGEEEPFSKGPASPILRQKHFWVKLTERFIKCIQTVYAVTRIVWHHVIIRIIAIYPIKLFCRYLHEQSRIRQIKICNVAVTVYCISRAALR